MNNEPQYTIDPEDRLIDRGLDELVGGDVPPDLSERILAAAIQEPLSTPSTGDLAVNENRNRLISKRKRWAFFGAAASLLIAVGAVVSMRQLNEARVAKVTSPPQKTDTTKNSESSSTLPSSQDKMIRSEYFVSLGKQSELPRQDEGNLGLDGLINEDYGSPREAEKLRNKVQQKVIVAEQQSAPPWMRFRIDATPGSKVDRYLAEIPPTPGIIIGDDEERLSFSDEAAHTSHRASTDVGGRGVSNLESDLSEPQERTLDLALMSKKLGKDVPASTDPALNPIANEVREAQQKIVEKKRELLDIEVMKTLAIQQANSSSTLEAGINEEMARDPMFQSFQEEQHAVTEQLNQMVTLTKRKNSPEVKRLQEHLRTLDRQIQEYRVAKEDELRNRFKSAPNDQLASVMSEYILRRRSAEEDLAKLERQYKKRIERLQDIQRGQGPDNSGDQYTRIYENPFIEAQGEKAVSTFSIDVDTASYANVRQFLMQSGRLPPPDAVRLEELVNYFDYDYSGPTGEVPFAAHVETAGCPWQPEHRLVRIGIKGHEIERTKRPQSNLVFLIDVSGSMNDPAKLPLLIEGMKMLTRELGENDRVAIVVYASSEGLALPSTTGDKQATILAALEQLRAGGSTAGGAGIELAYQKAKDNFIEGGTNRVILCTDGDFNVGVTSTGDLARMAELKAKESGIFLTVLGFGRGNLNDSMMEAISGKGNGNYHYVDNQTEARKVLVEEMAGTLITIAKDVKIQVEFNPAQVAGYRLLGYENRMLRTEDFNDDKKDAGEIGAGHTVTALYEVVPAGKSVNVPGADPLKYQQAAQPANEATASDELLTLKIRYKAPDGDTSTKLEFPITDGGGSFAEATDDFQFAAAVASFGMLLRDSVHRGNTSYAAVLEIAENSVGRDMHEYRAEFLQLVQRAQQLAGE